MASGVGISDECLKLWELTKLGRAGSKKWFTMVIDRDAGLIVLEKFEDSGKGQASYEKFVEELPPREGRYAIYDFDYTLPDGGIRTKLGFIVWAPDDAPIKEKMLYASSKVELKTKFNGIHFEVQATDYDEVEYEGIMSRYCTK